ncbi:MAG: membrane protein [Gammaproteobacteria bacterium]|nr:MAG: membrane protein [Gammaproteobacteria bacterium]
MNAIVKKGFLCLSMLLPLASVHAADVKIAYVNIKQVFENAPQTREAEKTIQEEFTKRQEKIKKLQQEILALRERLGKEGLTMSDKKRAELESELLRKDREFRWEQQIYDEDLKIRRNQVLNQVQNDLIEAIYSLAKDEGYDLILTDGVVYASKAVNITDRVLEVLKKK